LKAKATLGHCDLDTDFTVLDLSFYHLAQKEGPSVLWDVLRTTRWQSKSEFLEKSVIGPLIWQELLSFMVAGGMNSSSPLGPGPPAVTWKLCYLLLTSSLLHASWEREGEKRRLLSFQ
jgi:hypothetical protein